MLIKQYKWRTSSRVNTFLTEKRNEVIYDNFSSPESITHQLELIVVKGESLSVEQNNSGKELRFEYLRRMCLSGRLPRHRWCQARISQRNLSHVYVHSSCMLQLTTVSWKPWIQSWRSLLISHSPHLIGTKGGSNHCLDTWKHISNYTQEEFHLHSEEFVLVSDKINVKII